MSCEKLKTGNYFFTMNQVSFEKQHWNVAFANSNEYKLRFILCVMIYEKICRMHMPQEMFNLQRRWQTINSQEVFEKNYTCKKGNFNRPFEYIVFQMGQINVCRADISEASER